MGKDQGDVIEDLLWDAWNRAEAYRQDKGERARKPFLTERKQIFPGAPKRTVGPRSYKITLWLRPWEYLELFEQQKKDGHRGSLTKWMQQRLTDERIADKVPTRENLMRMRAEAKEAAGLDVIRGAKKVKSLPPARRRQARVLPPLTVKTAAARRRRAVG